VTEKRHVLAAHSVRKESLVTLGWQAGRAHRRPACVRSVGVATILAASRGSC